MGVILLQVSQEAKMLFLGVCPSLLWSFFFFFFLFCLYFFFRKTTPFVFQLPEVALVNTRYGVLRSRVGEGVMCDAFM